MLSTIRSCIEEALIKAKKITEIILQLHNIISVKDGHAPSSSASNNMGGIIMRHLPEEIIEEIVVRLPVKSIIRFKCVSKSWFILITNTPFIYKHLITSKESFLARISLLHNDHTPWFCECVIRSMNIPDIQIPAVDTRPVLNFKLSTPYSHHLDHIEFVGHCNGIMCLKFDHFIFLVNPSLKQVKNLPIPSICDDLEYCKLVGFGFDNLTMDFKVVRMLSLESFAQGVHRQRFEIYSLRSNTWRKLDKFPLDFVDYIRDCRSTFLNGVIHWCVQSKLLRWRMLIFNMATELFQQIEFPQGCGEGPDLFVLNQDSIAFASYLSNCISSIFVDIWTVNIEKKKKPGPNSIRSDL